MIKLSDTSKMPCKSWSLTALDTCPGSRDAQGEVVEVCQGCYATTGNYNFPNVKLVRENNRHDWKRVGWVNDMVEAIDGGKYFRWFDSGDIYHDNLAKKILAVIKYTPDTKHWLPTRSHKIGRIRLILTNIKKERNVAVRYSSDNIGKFNARVHGSVVFSEEAPDGTFPCEAYTRGGSCGDCRACWDTSIKTIAYPSHGLKMERLIKQRAS